MVSLQEYQTCLTLEQALRERAPISIPSCQEQLALITKVRGFRTALELLYGKKIDNPKTAQDLLWLRSTGKIPDLDWELDRVEESLEAKIDTSSSLDLENELRTLGCLYKREARQANRSQFVNSLFRQQNLLSTKTRRNSFRIKSAIILMQTLGWDDIFGHIEAEIMQYCEPIDVYLELISPLRSWLKEEQPELYTDIMDWTYQEVSPEYLRDLVEEQVDYTKAQAQRKLDYIEVQKIELEEGETRDFTYYKSDLPDRQIKEQVQKVVNELKLENPKYNIDISPILCAEQEALNLVSTKTQEFETFRQKKYKEL